MPESPFNNIAGLRPKACNFIKKETLAQVFSCEFCEISKNNFLHRTPLVAASAIGYSISCRGLSNKLVIQVYLESKIHNDFIGITLYVKSDYYAEKTA